MDSKIAVTIWNEFRHEKQDENVRSVYPNGIHEALATPLREAGFQVRTAAGRANSRSYRRSIGQNGSARMVGKHGA